MTNVNIDDLTREDLMAMFRRERFVRSQLEQRLGALIGENTEMLGIIQDLQNDLAVHRHGHSHGPEANGEVTTAPPTETVAPLPTSS